MLNRQDRNFLDELRTRLYTAVISDVLDELGHRNQAMKPHIRPLDDDLVMAGFARTGLFREVEIDVPIECAGVRIEPGDLIFGDVDGVVVVPRKIEQQVLARAFEKVASENTTRDELLKGSTLKDVYARYGVL